MVGAENPANMDHPAPSPDALLRPWRTATVVASLVAAVELVALVGIGAVVLAKPLARSVTAAAENKALAPITPARRAAPTPLAEPSLPRARTSVLVLNGSGLAGAAAAEAARIGGVGYRIAAVGNAARSDYTRTLVMYRKGFAPEAARLANDLHVKIVGPLDGLRPAQLAGAHVAVVVGS